MNRLSLTDVSQTLEKLTDQLRSCYGSACLVEIQQWCYQDGSNKLRFGLWIEDVTSGTEEFDNIDELEQRHRDLMEASDASE